VRGDRPRICLDLNVFVAAEIALVKGREGTTPLRLVEACRGGRFHLIVSRPMLERLARVLSRPPLRMPPALATERTELIAELSALPGMTVAGAGVLPVRDVEDRGVLETALAGRAEYLATYNLSDFREAAVRDSGSGRFRVRDLVILHPLDLAEEIGLY